MTPRIFASANIETTFHLTFFLRLQRLLFLNFSLFVFIFCSFSSSPRTYFFISFFFLFLFPPPLFFSCSKAIEKFSSHWFSRFSFFGGGKVEGGVGEGNGEGEDDYPDSIRSHRRETSTLLNSLILLRVKENKRPCSRE